MHMYIYSGGRVKEVHGTARVYLALDDVPGLAMSRSLGDYVAHSAGTYVYIIYKHNVRIRIYIFILIVCVIIYVCSCMMD
jgi:hypothetical protein